MFIVQSRIDEISQVVDVLLQTLSSGKITKAQVEDSLHDVRQMLDVAMETACDLPSFDGSIEQAVGAYVQLRDSLSEDRHAWEEHEKHVKGHMERISMWLRDRADDLEVDTFATKAGTAYRAVKEQFRIVNWADYSQWLLETGNIHCLERRAAKLANKEIYDSTGNLPPGLERHTEVEFQVRRPTKRKQ